LADAAIPVHLIAFDLNQGCELLLSAGPATDAVAAAAAIPGVFPPVKIGERLLIDGGVVNNTPISHAIELGAERVYVLPTQSPGHTLRVPKGALDAAICGPTLLLDRQLEVDVARYSRDAEVIVLPAPNTASVQPGSFEHSSRLIGEGLANARELLAQRGCGRHLRLAT
jgi:NTE family protein